LKTVQDFLNSGVARGGRDKWGHRVLNAGLGAASIHFALK